MEEKKTDLRVVKTKKAIKNALMQLLLEKELDNITIKELAERAEINRKTFYNYYSGTFQVMEEIKSSIAENFESAVRDINLKRDQDNNIYFENITAVLVENADFCRRLSITMPNNYLLLELTQILKSKTKTVLSESAELSNEALDIIVDFTVPGLLAVYQKWLNSEIECSVDEFTKMLNILTFQGINGLL